ncbi:MAG: hypothetical protein K1X78_24015 [Verrucomicrobiaceae bacterium]|nr:hypothetical protein [Verrucomicrobiaceae bacterium]
MDEFEKIQKLIRLKKYETPGEQFVDEFVTAFRERQRAEMLKQPALSLLWESFRAWYDQLFSPRWTLAAAVVVIGFICGFAFMPRGGQTHLARRGKAPDHPAMTLSLGKDQTGKTLPAFSIETIRVMGEIEIEPDPGLLSKHFTGGYDQIVIVPHDEADTAIAVPYDFIHLDGKPDIR